MNLNEYDLNKLHAFRILAESGSMGRAATKLLRTPSAISQSLSSLERSLGFKLFHRSGIRLLITKQGKTLLSQIQKNETALESTIVTLQKPVHAIKGMVTLGLPLGFSARSFSDSLLNTLNEQPGIQLRLRFMTHAALAKHLKRNTLNLAISLQPLNSFDSKLKSKEIRKEILVFVASGTNPNLFADAKNVSTIPIVDYYQKPLLFEQWARHHRLRVPNHLNIRAYGATLEHVLEFVRKGLGAAVVPRDSVENEIKSGQLVEHPLDRVRPLAASVWLNFTHTTQPLTDSPNNAIRAALE